LNEMSNNFGVGFSDKLVAFGLKLHFQFEIVLDNPVMYDHNLAGAITVWVGVFFGGAAMGGPAGVTDAIGPFGWGLAQRLFQVAELAGGAANFKLAFPGDHRDAGGVVSTVFEFAKSLDDDRHNLLRSDIADNSAHARGLLKMAV